MFPSNPRQNVLERLASKEDKKNWPETRSGTFGNKLGHVPGKPNSPQRLPRLGTPPSSSEMYDTNHNLRRGKQEVVPPVSSQMQNQLPHINHEMISDETWSDREQDYGAELWPQVIPYVYGQPAQGMTMAQPYPMYTVPVMPMYAPAFLQHDIGHPHRLGGEHDQRRHAASLRRQRTEAATIIQKTFRGWQFRKAPRYLLFHSMCDWLFSTVFVENLVDTFLEEDIIPDLLLEVLTHKRTLGPSDPRYRASKDVSTDVLEQELTMLIMQTASSVYFAYFAKSHLVIKDNPTNWLCEDILHETVDSQCRFIVKLTVKELVAEHMAFTGGDVWLEDFVLSTIEPLLPILAIEAIDEYQYGETVSSVISEVTDEMARSALFEVWREECVHHHRITHTEEISRFAQHHLLDTLCLDHLLMHLSGNNLSLYLRDYTDQAIDGMIAGTLIHQFLAVDDAREETKSNAAIRKYHEDIFTDLALDVVLEELEAHLDEDARDLFEVEQKEDHISFDDCSSV